MASTLDSSSDLHKQQSSSRSPPSDQEAFDPQQVAEAAARRLQRSTFMDYLATASTLSENNPELMSSVLGIGPLPEPSHPVSKTYSPLQVIENYRGTPPHDLTSSQESNPTEQQPSQESEGSSPRSTASQDVGDSSWMFDLIESLTGWLYTSQAALDFSQKPDLHNSRLNPAPEDVQLTKEEEQFWSEWEWVLSRAEELAIQHSNERSKKIDEELRNLRRTANHLKQRPFFVAKARLVLSAEEEASVEEEDFNIADIFDAQQLYELETYPLQASLRSKLLRDVVEQFSDDWSAFVGEVFFHSDSSGDDTLPLHDLDNGQENKKYSVFIENYAEKPYSKNIQGALVSMGFQASHGSEQSLTAQVLGDILWSWWSTLMRSIRDILDGEDIDTNHAELLANEILRSAPVIARLWYETLVHAMRSEKAQGILPEQWKRRESEETARLNQLRAVGLVDARFRDGPSETGCLHSTISPARLAEVKSKLQEQFQFYSR